MCLPCNHTLPPPLTVTSRTPHYASACLGLTLRYNLDIFHLNNIVVICQIALPVSPPASFAGGAEWDWCRGLIGACQGRAFECAHISHCVLLMETNVLCIWTLGENECVWQAVNQPVMRGNHTMDRSISYFLRRQTGEKHHYSSGKRFKFHCPFISFIPLVSFSFCFLLNTASSLLRASLSTLNLAVWLFISAHFSPCLSHREGGGDPADQGWVMVYEHSLWAMRAPLGWIIYTGLAAEQTYVSQSHQRHSKADLRMGTHAHPGKQHTLSHVRHV